MINFQVLNNTVFKNKKFEDTKGVTRSWKYNSQRKKDKQWPKTLHIKLKIEQQEP